jgi:hypothetical protein
MKMHPECDEATSHWQNDDYETFTQGELKRGTQKLK